MGRDATRTVRKFNWWSYCLALRDELFDNFPLVHETLRHICKAMQLRHQSQIAKSVNKVLTVRGGRVKFLELSKMSAIYTRRFIFFQGRVLRDLDHGWISLGEKFMFLQNCFIKSFFVFINSVINHPNLGGVLRVNHSFCKEWQEWIVVWPL